MNLSKLTPAVLGILLTALPFHAAFAQHASSAQRRGGTDGGGGGAIVHLDKKGNVLTAELLDLWEGRNLEHKWESETPYILDIRYSNAPVAEQIAQAMAKLKHIDPLFAERVASDLAFVQDKRNWNDLDLKPQRKISISPPADAQNIYFETGSDLQGMMYFDGELNKLSIKTSIFNKSINNTSVAASFTHEAIYKSLRDMEILGSSNSTPVRRINACLYANNDCFGLSARKPVRPGSVFYNCITSDRETATLMTYPASGAQNEFQKEAEMKLGRLGSVRYPVPLTARFNLFTEALVLQGSYLHVTNPLGELYLTMSQGRRLPPVIPNFAGSATMYPGLESNNMDALSISGSRSEDNRQLTITLPKSYILSNETIVPSKTFTCTRSN